MAVTKSNQAQNIKQSQTYDDTLSPSVAETASTNAEDDLNFIRSQLKAILGEADWFTTPTSTIKDLSNLSGVTRNVVYYTSEFQSITVPSSANFVALSSPGFPPSQNIALVSTTEGAISALLTTDSGVSHSTATATNEGNLLLIREALTEDKIVDKNGEIIFGLLQVDVASTDGSPFSLTGANSAQISFVTRDTTTGLLIAANVAQIENKVIEYSYRFRQSFLNAAEDFAVQALNFIRSPHFKLEEQSFPISLDGETVFALPVAYLDGGVADLWINGVRYHRNIDFTINGIVLTWLDIKFTLQTTDELIVRWQV